MSDQPVTLTGRVVETPKLSTVDHTRAGGTKNARGNGRPSVRTTFQIEGRYSGGRSLLHAGDALAERIVAELIAGDVITATCTPGSFGHSGRVLYVESFTIHPREGAA